MTAVHAPGPRVSLQQARRYRSAVRYQLLGPLAAFGDDGPIVIGGLKQRVVLAHLLLRVNQTVPADHLIDAVWGDEPPVAARGTLQAYVSRLRGRLGTERIEGHPPGYRFQADPEDLDSFRFEELLKEARDDGHEPKTALEVLDEALDLWRGPALADLALEPSLTGEIARLEELRLVATEERIAARLDLGHHAEVVAELGDDGTSMLRESPVLCDDRTLLSRDELLTTDEGRRALGAWESGEDSAFEEATRRLIATAIAEDERLFSTGSAGTIGA